MKKPKWEKKNKFLSICGVFSGDKKGWNEPQRKQKRSNSYLTKNETHVTHEMERRSVEIEQEYIKSVNTIMANGFKENALITKPKEKQNSGNCI